jgi:hypothetical protein
MIHTARSNVGHQETPPKLMLIRPSSAEFSFASCH